MSPSRKRAVVTELQVKFGISERRACKAIDQPRSSERQGEAAIRRGTVREEDASTGSFSSEFRLWKDRSAARPRLIRET